MAHKTFVLEWNPAISSYNWAQFESDFNEGEVPWCFNWSIWDYNEAHRGDRFVMIKCGDGKTGIVMSGSFASEPYEAEDWSGHGRQVFYADLDLDTFIHPEKCPMLTTEQLDAEMPEFQWKGGHSGRLLPTEYDDKLEIMWKKWLRANEDRFDCEQALKVNHKIKDYLASEIDNALEIAQKAHKGAIDLDGNPVILHPLAVCHAGKTELEKVVGLLHDVVEDTDWTFEMLADNGISETAIEAVRLLTKDKDIPYMDYVRAICESGNVLAIQVKINDLKNNIQRGTASGIERLVQKHTNALNYIINYRNALRESDSSGHPHQKNENQTENRE